ncbi:CHAT domain-containing protein [Pseudenhygromyxa sp. WMMC2535]|uniref:CHAT domain-containing protein n=1 Tax=Pseudenhygromyxa sp. WMMC2535 TaxID=2712867 RepID=UPI001557DEAA|nr:CHAT domain-containing protein [Pseudenhygromyxa sp. WMMC2535]NVB37262.1 CHAT domain-containing protein [Pseudenhygromyxa sp. WMMC2535]NVB43469.1 CHAT domain-containing protein [Pseudenhygromyxa sp. WMMC2535]
MSTDSHAKVLDSVQALFDAHDYAGAAEAALAALDELPPTTSPRILGTLHLTIVEVHNRLDRLTPELGRRCREALTYLRGDPELETRTRLAMIPLGLDFPDYRTDTDDAFVWLRDRRGSLTPSQRVKLTLFEAADERRQGREYLGVIERGVAELEGTPEQRYLRLQLAHMTLREGTWPEWAEPLIAGVLRDGRNVDELQVVKGILWEFGAQLPEPLCESVLEWGRDTAPEICGMLLARRGRQDEALQFLRQGAQHHEGYARVGSLHALLEHLPPDAMDERLRCAQQLVLALDRHDDPSMRHDVAFAMAMVGEARKDPELLEQALSHVERAAPNLRMLDGSNPGRRLMAELLELIIKLRMLEPTPALATYGVRLLWQPFPGVDPRRLAIIRSNAAFMLTAAGPICAREVIEVADMLAHEVLGVNESLLSITRARAEWMRSLAENQPVAPGDWPPGPFDRAAPWLVALVHGHSPALDVETGPPRLELLEQVISARSDRADAILAWLFRTALASPTWLEVVEPVLRRCVEIPDLAGPDVWPELHVVVGQALEQGDTPDLRMIALSIARARGEELEFEPSEVPASGRAAVELLIHEARYVSTQCRDSSATDRTAVSAQARAMWRHALAAARELKDSWLEFTAQVGLGNSLQWGDPPDVDGALAEYQAAQGLGITNEQGLAKLWKVTADTLRKRGSPDDIRWAQALIDRSIALRTGRLRAESLSSATLIAELNPDADEVARLRSSVTYLMDAARADEELGAAVLEGLCDRIVQLRRLEPGAAVDPLLDELQRRYPQHEVTISRARHGVSGRQERLTQAQMMELFRTEPELQSVMAAQILLAQGSESEFDDYLQQLDGESAGHAVARVFVLQRLVLGGRVGGPQLREAIATARAAIARCDEPRVKQALLVMLSTLMQPAEPAAESPAFDLDLSGELARAAIAVAGGEDVVHTDALAMLARCLRYTRSGDRNQNLRRSRDLYHLVYERARADGDGDSAAHALNNRVDAELEMGVGDRMERWLRGIETLQHGLELAQSPTRRAELQTSIAWYRTKMADYVPAREREGVLVQALAEFDAVDQSAVPRTSSWASLRAVCEGGLASIRGGDVAELELYERRLADPSLDPYERATFEHNLAIKLRRRRGVTATDLLRSLNLFESSTRVRAPHSARHAWETCYEAGLTIVEALFGHSGLNMQMLPWPPREAVRQAHTWLSRALSAAAELGGGQELTDAAFRLVWLACGVTNASQAASYAEQAWSALLQAAPYLLLNDSERAQESRVARHVALHLAKLHLDEGVVGVGDDGVRALDSAASELVLRWMLRAEASARRVLDARLVRPNSGSASWWSRWQESLDARDGPELGRLLEQIHQDEPRYLVGDPSLEQTWRWLEHEPGAVGVSLLLDDPVSCIALLHIGSEGQRLMRVLCLEVPVPPHTERELGKQINEMIRGQPRALAMHESMVRWARGSVVEPLLGFLRTPPRALLWVPGPLLRLVTPSILWHGVPVACSHTLALKATPAPTRPNSTLVCGAFSQGDRLLSKFARPLAHIARGAGRLGPVKTLVSAGRRYGKQLRPLDARDSPASAKDLLAEAPNHGLLIVLAHGAAGTADEAVIVCVDRDGSEDDLTGRMLAEQPEAFAGATVMLLSCSAGRISGDQHSPDGVAGALLSAGAKAVVAPLWSVYLSVAERVALDVLDGLKSELSLWQIIAELPAEIVGEGEVLEATEETRAQGLMLQRQSFVVWLG